MLSFNNAERLTLDQNIHYTPPLPQKLCRATLHKHFVT